jgi:ABC-2 type transport system ATP-binding protein
MTVGSHQPKVGTDPSPLRVEGFGRRYRRTRPWAVRDVTFDIQRGSITALVGPNGAGKSTLIRACLGFERPDEGRILVRGIDPERDRTGAVNAVGYVPQAPSLYRPLTIGDHLDMVRVGRPQFDRRYAASRVRAVGLTEERPVGDLSGGEQAQVALALALGMQAELLLLDEPLASLDPLSRRDFLALVVEDVRGRAATAVLSSHVVTDIEQTCDRLVVLAGGRLALDMGMDAARETHRTVDGASASLTDMVATFPDAGGRPLTLVRATARGRPATLEEIVLGYLAAARSRETL